MRRVPRLRRLDRHARLKLARFSRRAALLRTGRGDAGQMLDMHQRETEVAALVINLQSYWSNWCRAYYFSAALGTVSVSGAAISSSLGLTTEHDALTVAITGRLSPNKAPPFTWPSHKEPKWFSPDDLSKIISDAHISAASTIVTYLNAAPIAFAHLRTFRNYYAHREHSLQNKANAIGPYYLIGRPRKPSDILLFVEPSRSVSVLERWILDMSSLAGALCA